MSRPVRCCDRCGSATRWTYAVYASDDDVEFLVAIGELPGGARLTSFVTYSATGLCEAS